MIQTNACPHRAHLISPSSPRAPTPHPQVLPPGSYALQLSVENAGGVPGEPGWGEDGEEEADGGG
jgi:hypothetical protein